MVSAAEQLAANLNFGALAKADELKKRIWFTLGALLVYRLGTYIPLPGIDPNAWDQIFQSQQGGGREPFKMASAAEQLAANINFGAFAKADELKKRIWFTLGAGNWHDTMMDLSKPSTK